MPVTRTPHRHRRVTTAAVAATILAGAGVVSTGAASGTSAAPSPNAATQRGTLLSAESLYTLTSAKDSAAELTACGYDPGAARHGVDAYRLLYRTIDTKGQPTTASGLFTVPRGVQGHLRTVSFAHGTGVHRIDAPSMQRKVFLTGPSITYASAGFATVAPDYLAMGTGPAKHPWMDVPSQATASLDLLRAARQFAPTTGRALNRDVLATGFSQGASAALGLARALQAGEDRHFRPGALAPISGAYDFGGAQIPALLAGDSELEPRWRVVYAAYTLVAFDRVHDVYDNPGKVFRDPAVEELFDGMHTGPQMINALPRTPDELLTPYGRDLLTRPKSGLTAGLRTTDSVCKHWKPTAPIRLYRAQGDEQATVQNTANCAAAFQEREIGVPVIDLGTADHQKSQHLGSNVKATAKVVRWFSTLPTRSNP
ncbi:lipase [Streptomyces sp. NBC_01381]|uniref:alpha/beta hydrolase family protein n=1 Tax=Streptomyces sp. NBC_01381 TaxID=2903845 RepID=UPI00225BE5D1|nr:lipase [Streptomyces sp. NBC_01381]MCX4672389.1 lipase [Streptomyces sp. NBC_01381]MCX4673437.1 lipase [Streptomyces sp. NBC_01381]MCX4673446.1 lipase [Streptomyces sp. NBC_01381]